MLYQCEKIPEITPLDLNPRFGCDGRRVELVSIAHRLVAIVGHIHLDRRAE